MSARRGARRSAALALLALAGCSARAQPAPATLWQLGPVVALDNAVYDGATTVGELRRHGDFGVGVFQHLNGEMVVVDGRFYQVHASTGVATVAADTQRVPFAILTRWTGGRPVPVAAGLSYPQFQAATDGRLPTINWFYALRMEGTFSAVLTRSLPEQTEPYPPLDSVVAHEPTFPFTNVRGTMVGFREPTFVGDMSVPQYHLHFVTEDGRAGGHVLSFTTADVRLEVAELEEFRMRVPRTPEYVRANLNQVDQ